MFGFIGKFKNEVVSGFAAVHERLITLEAKVEALFQHNKVVAEQDVAKTVTVATAEVAAVETEAKNVEGAVGAVEAAGEAVKNAE